MTIKIKPDEDKGYHSYSISSPSDDLNIDEICEMFKGLLLAMGYHQKLIEDRLQIWESNLI